MLQTQRMNKEISLWWKQALEDLDTAKANLKAKKFYASVLFCQQSVEKALKALWLKEKTEDLPFIHDLTLLGKKLLLPKKFFVALKELTSSYTETRYPDSSNVIPSKKFSKKDAANYINKSQEIIKWIKKKI